MQWLKKDGKGYRPRPNAIPRPYMEAQSNNTR